LCSRADDEDTANRFFLLKYSLNVLGGFELRWIDSDGSISSVLIKNINGALKIGDQATVQNWAKLRSVIKKVFDLEAFPKY